jgi:hypothetical protein
VTVNIGQNFGGTSYGSFTTNSGAIPPDCNGAVGPNHFVQFINGVFAVYNKTNGHRMLFMTDVDFWANAGVGLDASGLTGISDPRIIYDPGSQRWFASQIDIDELSQALDGTLGVNDFLLAVSATSDPMGDWNGTIFPSDPDGNNFADFPTLGVDGSGVYLAGDMFDSAGDPTTTLDNSSTLVSFPKSDLLAIPPNFDNMTMFSNLDLVQHGQVLQPVSCFDGSSTGTIVAVGDIGNTSAPHSNLVMFTVHNITGPGSATLSSPISISVPSYVVPDNPDVGAPAFTPTQPDGTHQLMANDARFSARVYSIAGTLYAVHSTEVNNRIAVRWYRLRSTDGTLLEAGTIADSNLDLFFPSIAANSQGTVAIGCNGCSINTFVSAFAYVGSVASGVTTFGNHTLLKSGVISYHGDDEGGGILGGGSTTSRWGDYSATSIDPLNQNRFWTTQMFVSDTNVWSTQMTELITSGGPSTLSLGRAGTNVVLSWSSGLSGYQPLFSTSLAPAAWFSVTQTQVTNSGIISVQVPISGPSKFFRLMHP